MNVHGAPGVPPWINGREERESLGVGRLHAAQELLADRVEADPAVLDAGVDALRVALPHVNRRAFERAALAAGDVVDRQRQRQPFAGLRDAG